MSSRISGERQALCLELRFEQALGIACWNWGLLALARQDARDASWYLLQAEDFFFRSGEAEHRNGVADDRRRFVRLTRNGARSASSGCG